MTPKLTDSIPTILSSPTEKCYPSFISAINLTTHLPDSPTVSVPPRWVCFDLDGTLVRAEQLERAFGGSAELCAYASEYYLQAQEASNRINQLFPTVISSRLDELHDRVANRLHRVPGRQLPGAESVLEWAAANSEAVFLSTGSRPNLVKETLKRHGWEEIFTLVCPNTRQSNKRRGDHFSACAGEVGLSLQQFAAEAMAVGDSAVEISHGTRAGMAWRVGLAITARRVNHLQQAGASHIIGEVGDLPGLFSPAS